MGRRVRNAFGEDVVTDDVVRFWFWRFENGNERVDDEERRGCPETCSDEEIVQYLIQNPHTTCSEYARY